MARAAEELCERFALFWRHEHLHDAGASTPVALLSRDNLNAGVLILRKETGDTQPNSLYFVAHAAMPTEMGMLPLRRDMVSQNLDSHALTLLCPPPLGSPLSVSFSAWESKAGTHTLDAVMSVTCCTRCSCALPCSVYQGAVGHVQAAWSLCPARCRKC